ncbi:hypothetical protein KJ849_07645 [bacterium]|nr:hypothetical protein [bacterium]
MPEVNGLRILEDAKKLYPDIVVIIMADCDLSEMLKDKKQLSVYAYIKKPIDIDELTKLLKEANL